MHMRVDGIEDYVGEDHDEPEESDEHMHHLFVYGTLTEGGSAAFMMTGAEHIGTCSTAPKYKMLKVEDDYEGLAPGGSESFEGDLYEISDERMMTLDDYEFAIYGRRMVELEDGTFADAYCINAHLLAELGERDIDRVAKLEEQSGNDG